LHRPKSITGFQTHDTPIVINKGDRAELDSDECMYRPDASWLWHFCLVVTFGCVTDIPLSTVLEGIVVMRKNPDAKT